MDGGAPIAGAGVTSSKRQRKPSVRLGDLGGQSLRRPAAAAGESKRAKPSSSQENHVVLPRGGGARRPKVLTLAAPPPFDDLDINNQIEIEDPNSKALLRVSDSEDPTPTSSSS